MSKDLQTYLDFFSVKPPKILLDELGKSSQFYTHCIFIIHNAAREVGLIDCNGIEAKIFDSLKTAFSIFLVSSTTLDEKFGSDGEQATRARFIHAFYAGFLVAHKHDKNNDQDTEYLKYLEDKNRDNANKIIKNKYKYSISDFLLRICDIVMKELCKFEYANGVNVYFAVESFFQFGVTLALYKK
ncbi:MAG: hypothetical protein K6G15_02740 [Desulfovibrio sp.]|nr:hypothetical protein [Desulfovibrio sp.]